MKKRFDFPAVLLFSAIFLGFGGCGARNVQVVERPQVVVETVDPFAYGDEFAYRVGKLPDAITGGESPEAGALRGERVDKSVSSVADTAGVPAAAPVVAGSSADSVVYRVQIGIYEERGSADRRAEEARSKVDSPVYIDFEPPFYRVRVGNFPTRKEAEEFVKILQSHGFRGSFWVMKKAGTP